MRQHRHVVRFATALIRVAIGAGLAGACVAVRAQDIYGGGAIWRDEQSHAFRLDALRGRATVLTMAYGACRRICSTSLRLMENIQTLADARGEALNFVVVGLDPAHDTPADWAAFRDERKLGRATWHFLSGDDAATRALAEQLRIHYWRYDDHVMHDFRIVLLSPEGRVVRSIERFDAPLASLLP